MIKGSRLVVVDIATLSSRSETIYRISEYGVTLIEILSSLKRSYQRAPKLYL